MTCRTALALLALLALTACHGKPPAEANVASPRGLQVERYDPVIPKAPLKGKLETMAHHPEDRAAADASADGPQPPKN
jgi:hypothetical protein